MNEAREFLGSSAPDLGLLMVGEREGQSNIYISLADFQCQVWVEGAWEHVQSISDRHLVCEKVEALANEIALESGGPSLLSCVVVAAIDFGNRGSALYILCCANTGTTLYLAHVV